MINLKITTVNHNKKRYNTVSDYFIGAEGEINLKISKFSDAKMEMIIAVAELAKILLCCNSEIDAEAIEDFGYAFDDSRKLMDATNPFNDIDAPNYKQQIIANKLIRIMCKELDIDWNDYQKEISNLIINRQLKY